MLFAAVIAGLAAGCGAGTSVELVGPGRSVATATSIPRSTPARLVALARRQALELGDARPTRIRIRLGRIDVVDLWGHFTCGKSCFWQGVRPPAGTHARITVDARTHGVVSLALNGAAGTQKPVGFRSQRDQSKP
jgi:hypothetical protein